MSKFIDTDDQANQCCIHILETIRNELATLNYQLAKIYQSHRAMCLTKRDAHVNVIAVIDDTIAISIYKNQQERIDSIWQNVLHKDATQFSLSDPDLLDKIITYIKQHESNHKNNQC